MKFSVVKRTLLNMNMRYGDLNEWIYSVYSMFHVISEHFYHCKHCPLGIIAHILLLSVEIRLTRHGYCQF